MFKKILAVFLISACFCGVVYAAPVNINSASAEKIAKSLKGIGPGKAAAIVQFRNENGPFRSIADLKFVKGIGDKTIEVNKNDIIILSTKTN